MLCRRLCQRIGALTIRTSVMMLGMLLAGWSGLHSASARTVTFFFCIFPMLQCCMRDSVKVSEVMGRATDAMVDDGRVRKEDKEGHDAAVTAAAYGRLREPEVVIDARRNLAWTDLLDQGVPPAEAAVRDPEGNELDEEGLGDKV